MSDRVDAKKLLKYVMRRAKLKAAEVMTKAERAGDVNRAGGGVVCSICGLEYYDHPTVEEFPDLHVTCEWRVFKL